MKKPLITRIISALLVAAMAFSLAACSDSGSKKKSSKKDRKDRVEKEEDRDDDDPNTVDSVSFTTLVDNDYYKISYGGIYTMEDFSGDVGSMYLLRFENKTDGVMNMSTGHFIEETYTLLYGDLDGEDILPSFAPVGEYSKPNFYVVSPKLEANSTSDFYFKMTILRGNGDYYVPTEAEYSKHCRLYFDPTDEYVTQFYPQCVLEIN